MVQVSRAWPLWVLFCQFFLIYKKSIYLFIHFLRKARLHFFCSFPPKVQTSVSEKWIARKRWIYTKAYVYHSKFTHATNVLISDCDNEFLECQTVSHDCWLSSTKVSRLLTFFQLVFFSIITNQHKLLKPIGDPTQPIFHGLALGFCVRWRKFWNSRLGVMQISSVFRYQHVGIGITKFSRWGF